MKKVLAILLSVMMLFTMVSATAFATEAEETTTAAAANTQINVEELVATGKNLIIVIHDFVGAVLYAVGETCPFCDKYHEPTTANPDAPEAEEPATEDEFANDIEERMNGILDIVMDLYNAIHNAIGAVLAALGEACLFCGTVHGATAPVAPEAAETTTAA